MSAMHRKPAAAAAAVNMPVKRDEDNVSTKASPSDGSSDEFEFGGSFGAASLVIGFPLIMWYMWIGATYYDGRLPTPTPSQSWTDFGRHLLQLVYEGAYPTAKAWASIGSFSSSRLSCTVICPAFPTMVDR